MKKFLLVLMIVCMYKTSVHGMEYAIAQGDHQDIIKIYLNPSSKDRHSKINQNLEWALRQLTIEIANDKQGCVTYLKEQKSQYALALIQLSTAYFNKFIGHLTTKAVLTVVPKEGLSNPYYIPSQKPIGSKEAVLQSLTEAINKQDYNNAAHTLKNNKLYRLSLYEKIQLIERARAYAIINDLKTKRSIKLKFKHSDEDLKPDPRFASERETSRNIVQLLETRLYRNIKTN